MFLHVFSDMKNTFKKIIKCFCLAEKDLSFGSTYNLGFEFRPRKLTGLVFHKIDNRGQTLTLFLKKGKVNENMV